jgi:ligand-binding sensor domain-containing protein
MKKLLVMFIIILVINPVLSCAPEVNLSQPTNTESHFVESFSIGTPVLDLLCTGGGIWAGTSRGVFRCDPETGEIKRYTEGDGLGNNTVRKITSDSNGNIWAACYTEGVCKFDGKEWQHFTVDDGLISNDVITLAADRHGGIWVSAYWGVSYYDGTEWEAFTSLDPDAMVVGGENPNNPDAVLLEDTDLGAADVILVASRGEVWFSNRHDGVTRFDGEDWTLFSLENGIEARSVSAITEDKDGNLWFGSFSGVTRFDGSQFTVFPIEEYESIIPRPYVQDIRTDKSGNIWIAAYGGSVSRYDGTGWKVFTTAEGLPDENGRFIFFDREGNPGILTEEGVSFLTDTSWRVLTEDDGIPDEKIRSMTIDDSGAIWFGSEKGEISRLDKMP